MDKIIEKFSNNDVRANAFFSVVFLIGLIIVQHTISEKYEYNEETKKNDKPNSVWLFLTILLSLLFVYFFVLFLLSLRD